MREAIEIRLHPDNFNRDDGFKLSHTWRPIIKMLQLPRSAPMAKQGQAQVKDQPRPPVHGRGLYYISDYGEHFHTSDPDDDDDRDGHRNVGTIRTPNAADSPRRLRQVHSPRKHQDLQGHLYLYMYTHIFRPWEEKQCIQRLAELSDRI
jgi:hypothetical protein